MAGNGISYVGRLINNNGQAKWGQSGGQNPLAVLTVVLAEQHTERNDKAAKKYQDNTKATDAYVPTTTSWHRVTIFGDEAKTLASDPDFNHGALIQVTAANYREEDDWVTKDNVRRAGRPETIGRDSSIAIFSVNGNVYGARDEYAVPIWDGGPIPALKGQGGGGGGGGREYGDDEGF
jgi:hypothetical protein